MSYRDNDDSYFWGWVIGIAVTIVILGLVIGGITWATGYKKLNVGTMGLSYGAGPFESNHFQGVKTPANGRFFNGLADKLVVLPTTTRNYLVTSDQDRGERAGSDVIFEPTADKINLGWEFNIAFRLNDDPQTIKKFWETTGIKYSADDCPVDSASCRGWDQMLDQVFRPQLENALRDVTARYNFGDLYGNAANQQTALQKVGADLKDNINRVAGGEFFCGATPGACTDMQVTLSRLDAPQQIKDAIAAQQTALANVQTQKNNALAADQQAKAIKAVAAALQEAGPNYVLLQILREHPDKLPELWVVPSGTSVNVQRAAK